MEREKNGGLHRGSEDLDRLRSIEKQQRRSRKARRKKKQAKKKLKPYPLIDSIEKSRQRVKDRLGKIKKRGDAIDEFGS